MKTWTQKILAVLLLSLGLAAWAAADTNHPKVIRFGLVGNPYNKPYVGGAWGYADEKGLLKKEFEKEGIDIQYVILTGTGPAINEAIANNTVDFGAYGDLVGVVGKAGGLKIHVIAITGGTQETYVTSPISSNIKSFDDLKGKKVGLLKGTYLHLSFNKFIKERGLSESDYQIYNLQAADGLAAIAGGSIDAYIGASNFLDLVDKGQGKIVYTTNADYPVDKANQGTADNLKGFGEIVVTENFEKKYPEIVKRVLKVVVQANTLFQDDKNRAEYFRLASKTGTSFKVNKNDLGNKSLRWVNGLSIDKDAVARLQETIDFAKQSRIIRTDIDINEWVRPQYLQEVFKDLGIEDHWIVTNQFISKKK
jgi:sulfonate transport system substrate-binding protein